MAQKFRGTGVALITPFKQNGTVDYGALEKLIRFNIEGGVNYFVILGTTGESSTLNKNERRDIWKFVGETVDEDVHLVAGIGGNNTVEVGEQMRAFSTDHYDAFLSVSPYYNKPSQEGIYRHYMTLAEIAPLPIIIYNVPGRTGSNVTAETTLRLAVATKRFIGVKEASGNLQQIMSIVNGRPSEDFMVISGDDGITLPLISCGCDGVISVVGQAFPRDFSAMVKAALKGDFEQARKLHYKLLPFMDLFFAEGSPGGVKAALNILGICENVLRLPMIKATEELYDRIKKEMHIS